MGLVEALVLLLRQLLKEGPIIFGFWGVGHHGLYSTLAVYASRKIWRPGSSYSFYCTPKLINRFSLLNSNAFAFLLLNIFCSTLFEAKLKRHIWLINMWLVGCLLYNRILVYLCSTANWILIANFGGKQFSTKYSPKGRCESFLLLKIVSPLLSASIVDFVSWISITIELWWNF